MRSMVVVLVSALCFSSIAFATPRAMSNAALDNVTAGAGSNIAQTFVDAFVSGASTSTSDPTTQDPATTTGGSGSQAVSAGSSTTAGAVADNGSAAINGCNNAYVPVTLTDGIAAAGGVAGASNVANIQNAGDCSTQVQTGAITLAATCAFNKVTTCNSLCNTGNGNTDFIGSTNTVINNTNNSCFEGAIGYELLDGVAPTPASVETNSYGNGVIAYDATVSDSFDSVCTDNTVNVCIKCSFNTVTNSLTIDGQTTVSGIVNANSLCLQNIGTNLNITTASSDVPSELSASSGATTLSSFGSTACTSLAQTNVGASLAVLVGGVSVSL